VFRFFSYIHFSASLGAPGIIRFVIGEEGMCSRYDTWKNMLARCGSSFLNSDHTACGNILPGTYGFCLLTLDAPYSISSDPVYT